MYTKNISEFFFKFFYFFQIFKNTDATKLNLALMSILHSSLPELLAPTTLPSGPSLLKTHFGPKPYKPPLTGTR